MKVEGSQVVEGDESRRQPGDGEEVDEDDPGRLPPSPKTRECSSKVKFANGYRIVYVCRPLSTIASFPPDGSAKRRLEVFYSN
eukprot:3998924-Pyramimonas_sp.AAC.1